MQAALTENHTLSIENRSKASLTGVTAVDSFNEKQVQAKLGTGSIVITGDGLTVAKFNTENGTLVVDGTINEIKYSDSSGAKAAGVFKRLFQ